MLSIAIKRPIISSSSRVLLDDKVLSPLQCLSVVKGPEAALCPFHPSRQPQGYANTSPPSGTAQRHFGWWGRTSTLFLQGHPKAARSLYGIPVLVTFHGVICPHALSSALVRQLLNVRCSPNQTEKPFIVLVSHPILLPAKSLTRAGFKQG